MAGLCEPFPGMTLGSWAWPLPYTYLAPTLCPQTPKLTYWHCSPPHKP